MRLLIIMIMTVFLAACQQQANAIVVTIGTTTIKAEVSATDAERIQGLQFRKKLAADEGMLFIYQPPRILTHWMKNTWIPLDIIWIDQNKKLINISENVPICKAMPCATYSSEEPAEYALEVNAGFAAEHQIKPGMHARF